MSEANCLKVRFKSGARCRALQWGPAMWGATHNAIYTEAPSTTKWFHCQKNITFNIRYYFTMFFFVIWRFHIKSNSICILSKMFSFLATSMLSTKLYYNHSRWLQAGFKRQTENYEFLVSTTLFLRTFGFYDQVCLCLL